ncbi:MAG: prepilin-type N-terminal cleavage/methylation domain-containing protein [Pseudomonadota bacterium]|nr:prepilin-type N-terminal cleavage/methylation domain-containing protein [Pseudomonadota bacterium]
MAKDRGFTLIELILVLILAGVLLAYAGPRFFAGSAFDERFAVDDTLTLLRFAHKLAVASGCAVEVRIDAASDTCTLRQRTNCASGPFERVIQLPVEQAPGRALGDVYPGDSVTVIVFDPLGRALNAAGTVADATVGVAGRTLRVEGRTGFAYGPL